MHGGFFFLGPEGNGERILANVMADYVAVTTANNDLHVDVIVVVVAPAPVVIIVTGFMRFAPAILVFVLATFVGERRTGGNSKEDKPKNYFFFIAFIKYLYTQNSKILYGRMPKTRCKKIIQNFTINSNVLIPTF